MAFGPNFARSVTSVLQKIGRNYRSHEYLADKIGAAPITMLVSGITWKVVGYVHDSNGGKHPVIEDPDNGDHHVVDSDGRLHEV